MHYTDLWPTKASGTAAMNRFMRTLHSEGIWIPKATAQRLAADARHFVGTYTYLASEFLSKGRTLYPLYPKLHMMLHFAEELEFQSSKSNWVWNILIDACYIEEDFVGRLCYLTRCVSTRLHALRAIQRYLTQLNLCWGDDDCHES